MKEENRNMVNYKKEMEMQQNKILKDFEKERKQ